MTFGLEELTWDLTHADKHAVSLDFRPRSGDEKHSDERKETPERTDRRKC